MLNLFSAFKFMWFNHLRLLKIRVRASVVDDIEDLEQNPNVMRGNQTLNYKELPDNVQLRLRALESMIHDILMI